MDGYPKRPRFFAFRFVRLMAKVCLANEIGAEACWLLAVIASTEDAGGYRKAVTFWNEQLFPLAGLGSVSALKRVREKLVESGWLHYEPGAKGRAAKYWVMIPDHLEGIDDGPTDEQPGEYSGPKMNQNEATRKSDSSSLVNQNQPKNSENTSPRMDQKADRIRTECEPESGQNPDHILPLPLPKKELLTHEGVFDSETWFTRFWEPYPRKGNKPGTRVEWDRQVVDESTAAAVVAGMMAWKKSGEWSNLNYVPLPSSFLSQRRWQDKPIEKTDDRNGSNLGSDPRAKSGKVRSGIERGEYDDIPDLGKASGADGQSLHD